MISFYDWLDQRGVALFESAVAAKEFKVNDANAQAMHSIFKTTYLKSTGYAWDFNTFIYKSRKWTFYGIEPTVPNDPNAGFISVRYQERSDLFKLTGMAGSPSASLKGFELLKQQGKPIWGGVSDQIAAMAARKGFHIVPDEVAKLVAPLIPGYAETDDGGAGAMVTGVGIVKKTLIVNDEYIDWAKKRYPQFAGQIESIRSS